MTQFKLESPRRTTAGDSMRHTWLSLALGDRANRTEALLVSRTLADLVDDNGEVRIGIRSLADAVGRPDSIGRTSKTAQDGLMALRRNGYVIKVNLDAPRRERGHYRLTIPAVRLAA